jgi:hypothetical protein
VLQALLHIDIHAKSVQEDTCQIRKNLIQHQELLQILVPDSAVEGVISVVNVSIQYSGDHTTGDQLSTIGFAHCHHSSPPRQNQELHYIYVVNENPLCRFHISMVRYGSAVTWFYLWDDVSKTSKKVAYCVRSFSL